MALAACASPTTEIAEDELAPVPEIPSPERAPSTPDAGNERSIQPDATTSDADAADAKVVEVTAAALLAKLKACTTKLSTAPYSRDVGGIANIDVCAHGSAVFWRADMDIDCDGKSSVVCNASTDPSFQAQTAATDSKGLPLDAAKLPFLVVPGVSSRWSYKSSGIAMGSVGAVIYKDKVEIGIVGDVGPSSILGEASYAMAEHLGIDPNPKIGGTSSEVVYVVFTGPSSIVKTKEDHAEAVALGKQRAQELIAGP